MKFFLNGQESEYNGDFSKRLLDVLREEFERTDVKEGCGEGECGACAVIINQKLTNSCVTAIGSVKDAEILTLEGLKGTKQFQIMEEAYAKAGAVQCGFCTPGMIMATHALLLQHPHPTEEEIRAGISGNLCRCTGYNMIVDAVKIAAEEGAGLW